MQLDVEQRGLLRAITRGRIWNCEQQHLRGLNASNHTQNTELRAATFKEADRSNRLQKITLGGVFQVGRAPKKLKGQRLPVCKIYFNLQGQFLPPVPSNFLLYDSESH